MRTCLTIREALEIAEFTGEEVTITLRSGTELEGVVEKIQGNAFRLWVDPEDLCGMNGSITKAWIPISAVRSVEFDEESIVFDCNHDDCNDNHNNHDMCDHDRHNHNNWNNNNHNCNHNNHNCNHNDHNCNHNDHDHDNCNDDRHNHNNCNRHNNERIAQGIREALNAALLTGQIVTVGLICHCDPVTLTGRIINVNNNTFCIRLEDSNIVREEKIENIEFIEF